MSVRIPELDDLFGKVGREKLEAILSGVPVESGAGSPDDGCKVVELTDEDLRSLKEFVEKEGEYVQPGPGDYFTDETLMRMVRAECPPEWSDEACRNWLDERMLEYALGEVARCGGDVRCYAEPTKFNVFVVLADVRRKRLASLPAEERERRLILALPGRIVARHESNKSMPEARRWRDVGALDCARLVPIILPGIVVRPAKVDPPERIEPPAPVAEVHEVPMSGVVAPSDDLSWLCPSK